MAKTAEVKVEVSDWKRGEVRESELWRNKLGVREEDWGKLRNDGGKSTEKKREISNLIDSRILNTG